MTLFIKECKKVIFSMTFLIYTIVTFAMYFTQYDTDKTPLQKPGQGLPSYGMTAKEVPEILMPAAARGLISEYISGSYTAYPVGFYKSVRLSEKKKERMGEIIYEITGVTGDALENYFNELDDSVKYIVDSNGNLTMVQKSVNTPEINIPENMTYEHFRDLMREADSLIGGGSKYSDQYIVGNFSLVPKTYEDALAEYEDIFYKEKISPAYARLFCDYMCIDLAVLPVFAAAALTDKDKRSQMCELINSRRISSAKLVVTRYLALVTVMLIPVSLAVIHAAVGVEQMYPEYETDLLAFVKYSAVWLIPNILLASAVGMLLTEAASPLIAVFAQAAWWFSDIFASAGALTGGIGSFTLVPRHNSLYGSQVFQSTLRQFTFNRSFYTLLSVFLTAIAVMIYEIKRRGGFGGLFTAVKDNKI